MEFTPDKFQLPMLYARRDEMIRWLIEEKKFNPKAAPKCVDAFLKSMKYVLQETRRPDEEITIPVSSTDRCAHR